MAAEDHRAEAAQADRGKHAIAALPHECGWYATFDMDDYLPLRIDVHLEESARTGRLKALGRVLQKFSPFMVYHDPPIGRKSAEAQLSLRGDFPFESWAGIAPVEAVRSVLELIRRELHWPNSNFLPTDNVKLAVTGYDLDSMYALLEIKKRFGVGYSKADIDKVVREDWDLGMLVRDILRRSSGKSVESG